MFSFFKKKYHEPVEQQRQDVQDEPIGHLAAAGLDCDELPNAAGSFGRCADNPIPVNGLLGTYKWLGKLLSPKGNIFYFHRIGSMDSQTAEHPIDAYECVDMTGEFWDVLFIDMYHPRRSNKVPDGFSLKRYDSSTGDLPFAFGVDIFCENFPYDLPDAIEERNGLPAFARRVRAKVSSGDFIRPDSHAAKLKTLAAKIMSIQT